MQTHTPDNTWNASSRVSDCSTRRDVGDLSETTFAAFEAVPDALVIIDHEGVVRFANHHLAALFAHPKSGIVGSNVEQLISTRSRRHYARIRARYTSEHALPPNGQRLKLYGRRRDGSEIPIEVVASPVGAREQPLLVVMVRDVSETRRVRTDLNARRLAAERGRRSAMQGSLEKSSFLATASHDLCQPLRVLALLNGTLRQAVRDPVACQAVVQQSQWIEAMSQLVNTLLDISKLESGVIRADPHDFAIRALFEKMRIEFTSLAESKGLELRIEAATSYAYSDPALVGQILRNLISNAIKYTHAGWVQLRSILSTDGACLEVVDTGIGIPDEQLPRTDEKVPSDVGGSRSSGWGYGLGLTIVRRLVGLLDLRLEVRSQTGEGTCFSLHVPSRAAVPLTSKCVVPSSDGMPRSHAAGRVRHRDGASRESDATVEHKIIAMIGHELRSPLATICNVISACRCEEGSLRLPNALDILDRQTRKALRLVDDLLDLSRSGEPLSHLTTSPVDLAALVTEVARDLSHELQSRGQRVGLQMPSAPVWIRGDAVRLAQVVWNLLDNASKCSGAGQRITIELCCDRDWVVLRVQDEGIGILPEDLTRIFNPFVRGRDASHSERPGIGLGLAITRQLVALHGGSIEAYSEGRGLGSRFTVRLPAISGNS